MTNISKLYKEYNGFIYRVLAALDYEGFLLYITHEDYGDMMFLYGVPTNDLDNFLAIADRDIIESHENYEILYSERFMH